MNYQEIGAGSSPAWNHKDIAMGAELEGRYIEKKTGIGPNKSNLYIIETSGGDTYSVWGSTVIDAKFGSVAIGKMVKIKFLGLKKGKNGKDFKAYAFWQGIDHPMDEGRVGGAVSEEPSVSDLIPKE